jgi:hypothetical protein
VTGCEQPVEVVLDNVELGVIGAGAADRQLERAAVRV